MTQRDGRIDRALEALRGNPNLTVVEAARAHDCKRRTLQDHWARERPEPEGAAPDGRIDNPDGTATLRATEVGSPAEVLELFGMDAAEWQLLRCRSGQWGDPTDPRAQLRIEAVPRSVIDLAAEPYEPLPAPNKPEAGDRAVVICGDHHAPHEDRGLHAAFCSFLSDERPSQVVILGDLGDYASVSRHRDTLGFAQDVKTCNRAVYKILHDYRKSSPGTIFTVMLGNHDARIEHYLHDNAPEFWQVGPAFEEEIPSYDVRRLWRLDELGVEFIEGDWERTKYDLTDSLSIRHGYITAKSAPDTMLNKHGKSQTQGHSHRLRMTFKTKHDPIDVRVHIEAGCMCEIEEGLGYAAEPDWQNGLLYGHVWENGNFALAPVPYVQSAGLLLPDGRRFSA